MTASKRARDEEAGRHAHEVASFEAELVAEVSTPPTRMASAGLVLACGGQPRRLVLVLLFMLIAVAALMISRQEQIARFARVRTCADRFRQRLNFTDFVKDMKPSRAAFDDVLSRVSPPAKQVAFRAARARKSTGGFVPYSLRLSMALRYMAGGSALDIMYLHGVGRSTFYACLWPTLRAIDAGLPAFSLPEDIKTTVEKTVTETVAAAKAAPENLVDTVSSTVKSKLSAVQSTAKGQLDAARREIDARKPK